MPAGKGLGQVATKCQLASAGLFCITVEGEVVSSGLRTYAAGFLNGVQYRWAGSHKGPIQPVCTPTPTLTHNFPLTATIHSPSLETKQQLDRQGPLCTQVSVTDKK